MGCYYKKEHNYAAVFYVKDEHGSGPRLKTWNKKTICSIRASEVAANPTSILKQFD